MHPFEEAGTVARRRFLSRCSGALGTAALAHLLGVEGRGAQPGSADPLAVREPHFAPRAKNAILIYQSGAPSQLDLFDPKPGLAKWAGQALPESLTKDLKLAFIKPNAKIMPSARTFKRHGESGMQFSDWVPHIGSCADDICMVRTMHSEAFNHDPGALLLFTGVTQFGRPSIGSWVAYGLGSESSDLPGFVVLGSGNGPNAGANIWSNGFLPSAYQGTRFRSVGDPILYVSNPDGITSELQRARLDTIRDLNSQRLQMTGDPEISARIASYELAFRMQIAVPGLLDFGAEPKHVLELYGIGEEPGHAYATNCLLARRMVERGVRFVMLTNGDWDDHKDLDKRHEKNCRIVDRPTAALIRDLKERGLLESTLVIWASEFGRTPMAQMDRQDEDPGRDHHPDCFSMWLAGGGTAGGRVVGKTDDIGLKPVEGKVHVHDLQATVLHCLGFDHENLTYKHQGRDFRLTDVGGRVVNQILS
ncbi:MAG: DUF1501 domain-containing protein [Bryobacterales bacterium]|nr:DUF1501 domain-containing protein [Bryobacterales bacterium]